MKEKIALVVNTLSGGGAEKTVANLSRELSTQYFVDIIVNDSENITYPYRGRLISLHMPADKNRMDVSYQIKVLVRRLRLLRRLKKERHYKAVLSFSEMTNLANVLSGGRAIISVHNSVSKSKANGWKHKLVTESVLPYCFKKAYKTVPCSKEIADELIKEYGLTQEKCCVIYNGIDFEKIKKKASEPVAGALCTEDEKIVVTVGRLTWEKGQWHLIRAIKKLRDEGIPVSLVIFGEGNLRQSLEELIIESGMEKAIFLPGFVKNPHKYMANANTVVFPSLTEGFSNAIVEALACGAPVISTDHETGAREILAPGTDYHKKIYNNIDETQYGVLIPVCDGKYRHAFEPLTKEETLLAEAIRRMITNYEAASHYRNAALKRAEQLDIHSVCEQWVGIIEG